MKKIILSIVAVTVFSSCKKEYICACNGTGGPSNYIYHTSKSAATTECDKNYKFPFSETYCVLF